MIFDDVKVYLPKFLSDENERNLYLSLKDFPDNIDNRFYTEALHDNNIIYQGDGIKNLLVVNMQDKSFKEVPCMVFSNTCDINIENIRNFTSQIVYAPIFNLSKYYEQILKNSQKDKKDILAHIEAIKKQEITQIFYLPQISRKLEESIVFLDRVVNFPTQNIERKNIKEKRIFTLSNYGVYVFLLKLSIHFTRITDRVDRD